MADSVKFDIEKLVCRFATPADFDDVININKYVYIKYDYLYGKYMEYQHDPKFFQIVAEYEGLIVAYRALFWIEKYKSFWSMSARVSPKFQKHGIHLYTLNFARQYFNAPLAVSRFSKRVNPGYMPKRFEHFLFKWSVLAYEAEANMVRKGLEEMSVLTSQKVVDMPIDDINDKIKKPDCLEYLRSFSKFTIFPIQEWIISEITEKCLILMLKSHSTFVTLNQSQDRIEAVSSYTYCPHLDGALIVGVNYFGNPDISIWKSHMYKCLRELLRFVTPEVNLRFLFNYPEGISVEETQHFLEPALGKEFAEDEQPVRYGAVFDSTPI